MSNDHTTTKKTAEACPDWCAGRDGPLGHQSPWYEIDTARGELLACVTLRETEQPDAPEVLLRMWGEHPTEVRVTHAGVTDLLYWLRSAFDEEHEQPAGVTTEYSGPNITRTYRVRLSLWQAVALKAGKEGRTVTSIIIQAFEDYLRSEDMTSA